MSIAQRVKRYTEEEYYRLEERASYKSDYYDGEIFAMSGGTANHSLIGANVIRELSSRLEGGPCKTFNSELRLKIESTGLCTYPDASVYCDQLKIANDDPSKTTYLNPTVVIEVLSKSTEGYDRGFKSANYRSIPSLTAYLLVSQSSAHVEIYERHGELWELREFKGLDAVLRIPPLQIEFPLARFYVNVSFDDSDPFPA